MTDPDRLSEIKRRIRGSSPGVVQLDPYVAKSDDLDWLVGEVDRLRDLLARLEWPETLPGAGPWHVCPVCSNHRDQGHEADCWLAAALGKHEDAAPKDAP